MDEPLNRMSGTRKRGRPTNAEIEARSAPEPVVEAMVTLPPVTGLICPHCGRAMVPRVLSVQPKRRYVSCTSCGRNLTLTYTAEKPKGMVQKI